MKKQTPAPPPPPPQSWRFTVVGSEKAKALFGLGIYFIVFGILNVALPDSETRTNLFQWLPGNLNADELGWVWVVGGVFIAARVFLRKDPQKYLRYCVFVGAFVPVAWAIIFFISAGVYGNPSGWRGGLSYMFLAAMVVFIAGWTETKYPRR